MTFPKLPKDIWKKRVGSVSGAVLLGGVAAAGILLIGFYLREPVLAPSPALVSGRASGRALGLRSESESVAVGPAIQAPACRAGEECDGPAVEAVDPEGDSIVYRFFDEQTGEVVAGPLFALSGQKVAPRWRFDAPGEKRLYLTVEDSGGHAAPRYPVLVPVE